MKDYYIAVIRNALNGSRRNAGFKASSCKAALLAAKAAAKPGEIVETVY